MAGEAPSLAFSSEALAFSSEAPASLTAFVGPGRHMKGSGGLSQAWGSRSLVWEGASDELILGRARGWDQGTCGPLPGSGVPGEARSGQREGPCAPDGGASVKRASGSLTGLAAALAAPCFPGTHSGVVQAPVPWPGAPRCPAWPVVFKDHVSPNQQPVRVRGLRSEEARSW